MNDSFVCLRCGACCRIKDGIVRVSDAEIARIAAFLGMDEADFIENETDVAPDRKGLVLKSLSDGRLPCCRIVDWPRLRWRGFMNDCGKNFLPLEGLYALLDVMAAYKMNLFHWHLTDYQGWRLESKRYPQLQRSEAFTRQVGCFYTQADFRAVVAYAKARGITVMPELDVPGHTLAFRRGMGIDSMAAPGTEKVVAELFEELCSLADADALEHT